MIPSINTGIGKGRFPRIPLEWPVILLTPQDSIFGETRDISVSGALILCPYKFEANDKFQILLTPPTYDVMPITCEKAWSGDFYSNLFLYDAIGVRFTKISSSDSQIIASKVAEYYPI